jgi:type II secretory pathway component GspD/PulD (secretin)
LSGDEFEALLKASRQNEGVTVLATPVVTTATGQHAKIEATQTRATSSGEPYTIKQVLDFIPTGSSYGESVQMLIVAQLNYSLEGTLTRIAP